MRNIIQAWKDEAYLQSLSTDERAMLPANPAGEFELTDAVLAMVHGTQGSEISSSCTLSQHGGLNVGIPNISAFVPVLAVPIGTQQNPTQCISGV